MRKNMITKGIVGVAVAAAFDDDRVEEAVAKLRQATEEATEEEIKALGEDSDGIPIEKIVAGAVVAVKVVKLGARIYKAVRAAL